MTVSEALAAYNASFRSRICKLQLSDAKKVVYTFRRDLGAVRTAELGKPLELGPGDQRYVDAVLRAGGFRYLIKLPNGKYAEVRP